MFLLVKTVKQRHNKYLVIDFIQNIYIKKKSMYNNKISYEHRLNKLNIFKAI